MAAAKGVLSPDLFSADAVSKLFPAVKDRAGILLSTTPWAVWEENFLSACLFVPGLPSMYTSAPPDVITPRYQDASSQAYALLWSVCDPSVHNYIREYNPLLSPSVLTPARLAFAALKDGLLRTDVFTQLEMQRQFIQLSASPFDPASSTIDKHILRFEEWFTRARSVYPDRIHEDIVCLTLVSTFPERLFGPSLSSIVLDNTAMKSLKLLRQKLTNLHSSISIHSASTSATSSSSSFIATPPGLSPSTHRQVDDRIPTKAAIDAVSICWNCDAKGHRHPDCSQPANPSKVAASLASFQEKKKRRLNGSFFSFAFSSDFYSLLNSSAASHFPADVAIHDGGSSHHIARCKSSFNTLHLFSSPLNILGANPSSPLLAYGIGTLYPRSFFNSQVGVPNPPAADFLLHNVLWAPDAPVDLVSTGRLAMYGTISVIISNQIKLYSPTLNLLHSVEKNSSSSLFQFRFSCTTRSLILDSDHPSVGIPPISFIVSNAPKLLPSSFSHRQFILYSLHLKQGHSPPVLLQKLLKTGIRLKNIPKHFQINSNDIIHFKCSTCDACKTHRAPISLSNSGSSIADKPCILLHLDIESIHPISIFGNKYILTIVDDFSRRLFTFYLKTKDQLETYVKFFITHFRALGYSFARIRMDGAGENTSHSLTSFLHEHSIIPEITSAHTPALNGKAERPHRTLRAMTSTALSLSRAPPSYWEPCHALQKDVKNFMPHSRFMNTSSPSPQSWLPAFKFDQKIKSFPSFQPFGTVCYFHNVNPPPPGPTQKFSPQGIKCMFLGFSDESYKLLLVLRLDSGRVFSSVHISFPVFPEFLNDDELASLPLAPGRGLSVIDDHHRQTDYMFGTPSTLTGSSTTSPNTQEIIQVSSALETNNISQNEENSTTNSITRDPNVQHNVNRDISGERDLLIDPICTDSLPTMPHLVEDSDDENDSPHRSTFEHSSPSTPQIINFDENNSVSFISVGTPTFDIPVTHTVCKPTTYTFIGFATNNTTYKHDIDRKYKIMAKALSTQNEVLRRFIPLTYEEALSCEDSDLWIEAIKKELLGLTGNGTWELIHPRQVPAGSKPLKGKWVFDIKHDGRYKARFVVKGFLQQYLRDYTETFSPVINSVALKVLMSLSAQNKWKMRQFDVPNAFLKGTLKENIYMEQPKGNNVSESEKDYVCKLIKSLYGLKQASREFYLFFSYYLMSLGFKIIPSDECIFIKRDDDGDIIITGLHVDDGSVVGSNDSKTTAFLDHLKDKFSITTSPVQRLLGMDVKQSDDNSNISISMRNYILEFLHDSNMDNCNPVRTPMEIFSRTSLSKEDDNDISDFKLHNNFRSLVGSLSYLCNIARPDIAVAVNYLSRNQANPQNFHWRIAKRLCRYLKGTLDLGIVYSFSSTPAATTLFGYADADWASDVSCRNSTSGYIFKIGDHLISWKCKLQHVIALSTTEAEYYSLSAAIKEAKYLRSLLHDLGFSQIQATTVFEDNQGCVNLAHHSTSHERTKHIDIKHHYIRQEIRDGNIRVIYCPTRDMTADIMTKPLNFELHSRCVQMMGLKTIPTIVTNMGG